MARNSRRVEVGGVAVGGGAPVSVQSMANAPAHDARLLAAQAEACEAAGCDIFRLTVPDEEAARVLGEVGRLKKRRRCIVITDMEKMRLSKNLN